MQILKWLSTALAGYALLEIGRALFHGFNPWAGDSQPAGRSSQSPSRPLTGPGRGMQVEVRGTGGVSHRQVVGRGVVHR